MEALSARKAELRQQINTANKALPDLYSRRQSLLGSITTYQADSAAESQHIGRHVSESRAEDRRIICQSPAKYLVSSASMDDGLLKLFWNRLEFSGWRGKCEIKLAEISSLDPGVSRLAVRLGVPIVERWWPGGLRERHTLLLRLSSGTGDWERAVLAGLPPERHWLEVIEDARSGYTGRVEARAERASEIDSAAKRKLAADDEIAKLQGQLQGVEAQIRSLEGMRRSAERELQLPDWEHRTVHMKGRNLIQQLEREMRTASAAGWELVSTASPRKDELIATLKRVRHV